MPLIANLTRTAVTEDGTQSTWSDNTTYGGANPLRSEVATYLTAYKVDSKQVETTLAVTTTQTGNFPETNTTFTTVNGIDGWHKYYFVVIPYWDNSGGAPIYNRYDLVWDSTLNAFYEYINVTPSPGGVTNPVVTDTAYFTLVPDPTTKIANVGTITASGNLVYQVIEKVLSFQTSVCYIKAASKNAKENCGCDDKCNERLAKLFSKIRDLFNNLALNESTGQFLEGEKNARLAEKYCDDCGCLDR